MIDTKKYFLNFFLDTEIFTEEEAKDLLSEMGVDIEKLEKKKEDFLQTLKAKEALREGRNKKEEFLKLLNKKKENFNLSPNNDINPDENDISLEYKIAARKKSDNNEHLSGEIDDKKLLEELKKKQQSQNKDRK